MYRIGNGYDVHRLVGGRKLILGGVEIAHTMGLEAHSDGDVLLHALCDALLGAAALADIGTHFADTSDSFKDIDSRILLDKVCLLVDQAGYEVVNVDCTVIAQRPKIAPYVMAIRDQIARVIGVDISAVSVKATTTEKLGFEGREEGVSSICSALLKVKG